MGGGGLFDYSVNSWPRFDKVKARFSHVCDHVSQASLDQVGDRLVKARARSLTISIHQ